MFCSHCGKNLNPGSETCPNCGMAVGESRFEAPRGYTASQDKLRPGQAVRVNSAYGNHYSADFTVESSKKKIVDSDADTAYRAAVGAGVNGYTEDDDREPLFNSDEPAYEEEEQPAVEDEPEEEEAGRKGGFRFRFLHREEEPEEEEEAKPDTDGSEDLTEDELASIRVSDTPVPEATVGISEDVRRFMSGLREEYDKRKEAEEGKKNRRARRVAEEDEEEIIPFRSKFRKEEDGEEEEAPAKPVKPAKKVIEQPEDEEDEDDFEQETGKGLSKLKSLFIKKRSPEEEETEEEETEEAAETEEEPVKKSRAGRRQLRTARRFFGKKEEEDFDLDDEEEAEEETLEDEFEDEFDDETIDLSLQRESRLRILKYILLALIAVAIILGAVVGVSFLREETKTAPVETVTLPLWNEGIALMQERVGSSYRKQMLALYDKNDEASFVNLSEAMTKDLDGLTDLLPPNESRLPDDQRFVEAMKAIQQSINNCLSNDVLAMTDTTKTSKEKDRESSERWEQVRSYVTALTQATNPGMLDGIIKGERVELISAATPEPDPTPTPMPYQTLAKGAKGVTVINLQTRLTELGYMNSTIDGDYGNKTKTAVEKFQQKAGIKVTGIADVATQEALFAEDAPHA